MAAPTFGQSQCSGWTRLFDGSAHGISGNITALDLPIQGE